jgi:hypothetical protein
MSYTHSMAGSGNGTIFAISIASTFTPVFEITSIKRSNVKNVTVDVSSLNSQAREHASVFKDCGDVDLTLTYVPLDPGQVGLAAAFATGALTNFKITYPETDGETTAGLVVTFAGIVAEYEESTDTTFDKAMVSSCKIQVSGAATYTPGS